MNRELRHKLEINIIHRGDDLSLRHTQMNVGDLESACYRAYMDAWKQLHEYYKENNDSEISVMLIDEITSHFSDLDGILATTSPQQISLVRDAVNEFEWILNSITLTAHRQIRKPLTQGKSD